MRGMVSTLSAFALLAALAGLVHFLATGSREAQVSIAVNAKPQPTESAAAPEELAGTIHLPSDTVDGQFIILFNRMWAEDERNDDRFDQWRPYPLCWGAGRALPQEATSVVLGADESLGYVPHSLMSPADFDVLATVPRLTGLALLCDESWSQADYDRAMELPGLHYLETWASVLDTTALPQTVTHLALRGAPADWDFPWIVALQSDADYSGWMGPETVPASLPGNLDKLAYLSIVGWPRTTPLPRGLQVFWADHATPAALKGPKELVWVNVPHFDSEGDVGLEAFANHPCLKQLDLNLCEEDTDAGLAALSAAQQIEELHLRLETLGQVTSVGLSQLTKLPRLRVLHLSGCASDAMLLGLRGCSALEKLTVEGSRRISGTWLEVVPSMPALMHLNLTGCEGFTGEGARHFKGLSLDVRARFGDSLTSAGCREVIDNWPCTELSFLSCRQLNDDAFAGLSSAQHLKSLNLMQCDGIGVATIQRLLDLKGLTHLALSAPDSTSPELLGRLAGLPNLVELRLVGTSVDASVIEAIRSAPCLKRVELPWFHRDEQTQQWQAVWALIDARPDIHVYARSKGNPYDPKNRPNRSRD